MINFTIKGNPPSKSNLYKHGRNCFYKDTSVGVYEQSFHFQTISVPKHSFGEKDRLGCKILWYPPHLKSDLDGITKIVLDCCQYNGLIWNDNKVDALVLSRKPVDKVNPRIEVEIWKLE